MIIRNFNISFVIGFLIKDDKVLLLKRLKEPWLNHWNGVGGKIEKEETPQEAIFREVKEETTIDLKLAEQTKYVGIVTWKFDKEEPYTRGMFVFVSYLSEEQSIWQEERSTKEGILAWKSLDWTNDKHNPDIASNIPYFLPAMIKTKEPLHYSCLFKKNEFDTAISFPLPDEFKFVL